jgi:hypothetical protein
MQRHIGPEQRAYMRYLRNEVSKWEREANRSDHHPNAHKYLWEARKELREYRLSLERRGFSVEKVQ